jgi:hypothetical protein
MAFVDWISPSVEEALHEYAIVVGNPASCPVTGAVLPG